jgi:hypothetical protein
MAFLGAMRALGKIGSLGLTTGSGRIATGAIAGGTTNVIAGDRNLNIGDRFVFGAMAGVGATGVFNLAFSRAAARTIGGVARRTMPNVMAGFETAGLQRALGRAEGASSIGIIGTMGQEIGRGFMKTPLAQRAMGAAGTARLHYRLGRMEGVGRSTAVMGALSRVADPAVARSLGRGSNIASAGIGIGIAGTIIGGTLYGGQQVGEMRRRNRVARFQNSTYGIVQGMHAGRHSG